MITPPKDYKIIDYKEWAGRFLPKAALFCYRSGAEYGWYSRNTRKYLDSRYVVAIPNNHIPRLKIKKPAPNLISFLETRIADLKREIVKIELSGTNSGDVDWYQGRLEEAEKILEAVKTGKHDRKLYTTWTSK